MISKTLVIAMLVRCIALSSSAESAVKKNVEFAITSDVGFGNEVCVMGPHLQLGGSDPLKAPKLTWNPGNIWKGTIALEAGTTFSYQFISRNYGVGAWPAAANATVIGPAHLVNSPAHVAPPWGGKCVIYRSNFAAPHVFYRDLTHGGPWTDAILRQMGPGRTPGEQTFRADLPVPSGSEIEFVFNNGANVWDNAPAPPSGTAQGAAPAVPAPYAGLNGPYNYRSTLDVLLVQDGSVYNDLPNIALSPPRLETRFINSTLAGIPGRHITVLLPRGYDQNVRKRYPVLYFHDGQNVFFPGGAFGTWDADRITSYETSQGRMRETILVAVNNGNGYGSDRLTEYLPDGDFLGIGGVGYQGNATAYVRFLMENVMPTLDSNYRTLTTPANTLTAGSSMGGLVADYIGFSQSARFGGIGIFSPAYWAADNWVAQRDAAAKLPLRRYLYMGTAESSSGESSSNTYWRDALQAYDTWLRAGHSVNGDLKFEGGAGQGHNEPAWSRRLPSFFQFALDPMREASPLAQLLFPPKLEIGSVNFATGQALLRYTGLLEAKQTVDESIDLKTWNSNSLPAETELWEAREFSITLPQPSPGQWFSRLKQESW